MKVCLVSVLQFTLISSEYLLLTFNVDDDEEDDDESFKKVGLLKFLKQLVGLFFIFGFIFDDDDDDYIRGN